MSAKKYVIGNFKGGVGKSTCAQMLGFEAAMFKGKKTLIIDLDMQGNTSDVMSLTHMNFTKEEGGGDGEPIQFDKTIADVLMDTSGEFTAPEEAIYQVINNYLEIVVPYLSYHFNDKEIKNQAKEIRKIKNIFINDIKKMTKDYKTCLERIL